MSDTTWHPTASLPTLRRRAAMLTRARAHFHDEGVLEVETPIASAAAVSDPNIESVGARLGGRDVFLHTSPEHAMKRLLAAGYGDCYQICRVFRDGERGRQHQPEFTLIEWYRIGFGLAALMSDVERVVARMLAGVRQLAAAERITYRDAVRRHAGVDPFEAGTEDLRAALARQSVDCPAGIAGDRDALLDLIVGTIVGPRLGQGAPCFVADYPASQAALARIRPNDPLVAERFELYLDGVELANGFHELGDASEQRRRFAADQLRRQQCGQALRPLDEQLLAALAIGLPDCAGVALGFDRLVMCATGARAIDDVIAFPIERA
jgi:elongation factor P--(R)-beta-lysine ligase